MQVNNKGIHVSGNNPYTILSCYVFVPLPFILLTILVKVMKNKLNKPLIIKKILRLCFGAHHVFLVIKMNLFDTLFGMIEKARQ